MPLQTESSKQPPVFASVRKPASSLNSSLDPQDITDQETPDCGNVTFDTGYATPRPGSFLAFTKPTGETNALLNTINATTSNQKEYLVAIYAPNFYLRDEVNNQWIKLNGAYTPPTANILLNYGSTIWNNGLGDDRLYMGNGTDPTIKWTMGLAHTTTNNLATDTTLTLNDGYKHFPTAILPSPATGNSIIVQGPAGPVTLIYSSIVGNVLTLTTPIGVVLGAGTAVAMAIQNMSVGWLPKATVTTTANVTSDTVINVASTLNWASSGTVSFQVSASSIVNAAYSSYSGNAVTLSAEIGVALNAGTPVVANTPGPPIVPIGKLFTVFQGKMFVANAVGGETTMYYSVTSNPEDYTFGTDPAAGGYCAFIDGVGQITGIFGFGQYLGVLKGDSLQRFEFVIDSTNSTQIVQVTPLVTDATMGCPYPTAWVKKNNTLYYPSSSSGIFSISPLVTGFQTTIQLNILSQKIYNLYLQKNFSTGKTIGFNTKIFMTCASNGSTVNDTVLVYDTMFQYWTKFNNWAVADWVVHTPLGGTAQKLYYGSKQDNNIYVTFDPSYTDNNQPYTSYVYTKRFDLQQPSMPKYMSKVFVQGYINTSTNLMCDVLYNENGTLATQTFTIKGTGPYVSQPMTLAMAQFILGMPVMGDTDLASTTGNVGILKVYLNIPVKYNWYNVQLKFYSTTAGANWSLTGLGMNAQVNTLSPANLGIDPDGDVPIPVTPVAPVDYLLTESGGFLLQEDGSLIII